MADISTDKLKELMRNALAIAAQEPGGQGGAGACQILLDDTSRCWATTPAACERLGALLEEGDWGSTRFYQGGCRDHNRVITP